jgi:hypothetical protein
MSLIDVCNDLKPGIVCSFLFRIVCQAFIFIEKSNISRCSHPTVRKCNTIAVESMLNFMTKAGVDVGRL